MASPSALSVVALEFRKLLALGTGMQETDIFIGSPKEAFGRIQNGDQKQRLNVFFYRLEPDGYPSDGAGKDPLYVRAHCLVTPMGVNEPAQMITAGENDLRLIGAVMQAVHEHPVLLARNEGGEPVANVQIVPGNLSLDDINHLWATQGDTPYRLSAGYELALLPLPLAEPVLRSPRVAAVGFDVTLDPAGRTGGGPVATPPVVEKTVVDTSSDDWAPHLAFLSKQGTLDYALSYTAKSLPAELSVIVAGLPGTEVELAWEVWDPGTGWQPGPAGSTVKLKVAAGAIDPALPAQKLKQLAKTVKQPLEQQGQATLFARRLQAGGLVRSNPLLVVATRSAR